MGTRSLTNVFDDDDQLICSMYRQLDGYPSGHGAALAEFLKDMRIVNGIGIGREKAGTHANGMDCLAAQIVAAFKNGIGGVYLVRPRRKPEWEDYIYEISLRGGDLWFVVKAPHAKVFEGRIGDFTAFCAQTE